MSTFLVVLLPTGPLNFRPLCIRPPPWVATFIRPSDWSAAHSDVYGAVPVVAFDHDSPPDAKIVPVGSVGSFTILCRRRTLLRRRPRPKCLPYRP